MRGPALVAASLLWIATTGCSSPAADPAAGGFSDPALCPPTINTAPGPEYSDEVRDVNMVIGMDRTPVGRIWAAWVSGGDSERGYFVVASSDDGGATWSKPRLVIPPGRDPSGLPRRALVGNFWTDPTGRLWLFFDQSPGYFDGRAGAWAITCDNPDAGSPSWSAPRRLWHGATLNKPVVLRNGEWLMPISLWARSCIRASVEKKRPTLDPVTVPPGFAEGFHELDGMRMAHVFSSTDQGKTWSRRGGVVFPGFNFDEHMIVERRDGRLWMLARTLDGIAETTSTDGGRTWEEPRIRFPHTPARFHLRRLSSGRLLLVKHGKIDERTPHRSHLTAFLSDDDGRSWQGGLVLDERRGVSYPDGFQAPDGTLYIVYDYNRYTDAEILMAKFREEDILAGNFQSPGARARILVNKAGLTPHVKRAMEDAWEDRTTVVFDGKSPDRMVCDTTLRELPDGSWILFMLAGGDTEPSPKNYTAFTRSVDQGRTWSPLRPFDTTFPREGDTIGQGPTELMVRGDRCTLFFSTHARHWSARWRSWFMTSDDSCRTWSRPEPVPGRLANRTFIRNHVVTRDGRILVPFQHYVGPDSDRDKPPLERAFTNPRNGVLMSADGGRTWTEHGDIRLTKNDRYFGWAESNIAERSDGSMAMIIRADGLGGVLYGAESKDGGRTWPEFAVPTDIPNPGSKATLYPLGRDAVALLHNPDPKRRSPLALWISFDGMKTWPYRRVLVAESSDGPQGRLNYPDGFVSRDRRFLHFAYDDNRHRAVYYGARLPLPGP